MIAKKSTAEINLMPHEDWTRDCGVIRPFLNDPSVTEIMVNSFNEIFIEKDGVLIEAKVTFANEDALLKVIQSLVVTAGKELNIRNPFVDSSLPDGSRLNCVIPPVAVNGPSMTIRKFSPHALHYKQLLESKALDEKMLYFLNQVVRAKQNIIISGGTGSGKTTLLNVLSSFIPSTERIVTIEDTAELQIQSKNCVRLESRIARTSNSPITIEDLLKNALRMRPNRIIIGECRGAEAWDMLLAMNTGHSGSMTTMHANSSFDALRRLESMIMRTNPDAPHRMVQEDISESIQLVIHVERRIDGKRRIIEISEVLGRNEKGYILAGIFSYDATAGFKSMGNVPSFVKENKDAKIKFPPNFFDPEYTVSL